MAERFGKPQPQHGLARCYRHPDRETGIRCARCDRPICPSCMISAPVGYQCPDCVQGASGVARAARPRTLAGGTVVDDPRLITKILLGLNLAVFAAVLIAGDRLVTDLGMLGYAIDARTFEWIGVADGQWYRMLTAAFLHEQIWHLAFNMLGLWFLGPPLETALGRVRYLALYLVSALAGSTLSYLLAEQNQLSLGASGAIFGLFGATAVLLRRLRADTRPIAILLAINLVITFTWSNIAWQAHIGGLVAGAAIAYGMVNAPRERRTLVQVGTCVLVLVVIAVACVIRTTQLLNG
ncbi:rhomboid family intramembrane serine protease [Streptomyces sp. NBC_01803]|uniref:rhomboid family intramembrane serine protease n=1 Tax=Streptomyces sp. NBC_01803 TaxID=2975946 RepID=UPI002DDB8E14|nr:rhomboid family intramembrane serine protease [Streptomyces sp. NBC_01803]WSA45327.1 rhomboid family intramembrane serine protease [Streptomyces sp. NBC_01803]